MIDVLTPHELPHDQKAPKYVVRGDNVVIYGNLYYAEFLLFMLHCSVLSPPSLYSNWLICYPLLYVMSFHVVSLV